MPEYCARICKKATDSLHSCLRPGFCFIVAFITTFFIGCDEPFQPIAKNDHAPFSIYGVLDAGADTQKVRVTQIKGSTLPDPDPAGASVTLEHLGTQQKVVLRDSLYSFGLDETFYARNYLTDMELKPGETYRLIAEHTNGYMSQATVTLPKDFPELDYHLRCTETPAILNAIEVFIDGIDNLAAVTAYYYYESTTSGNRHQSRLTVQQYDNAWARGGDGYRVRINVVDDLVRLLGINGSLSHIRLNRISIFVANAGPSWPNTKDLSIEEQLLPEGVSNIESGIGFLGGIASKTITVKSNCL